MRVSEVLDEEVVPERELVTHREDKLDRLIDQLRPAFDGPADLCYLIGPTGTGKTMLSRLSLALLRDRYDIRGTYLNCWQTTERRPILYHVVDAIADGTVDRQTTSTAALADQLQAEPDCQQRYVVLDEADQLHAGDVLYDLHSAPDLTLVLIANNESVLFRGLDERLQSRLSAGVRVRCGPYDTSELAAILEKRADLVLPRAYCEPQFLEHIAERADGDARTAIRTLRVVYQQTDPPLDRSDVDAALSAATDQLRQKSLSQLNDHQRAVYQAVAEADQPLGTQAIHDHYRSEVDSARSVRRVRDYCVKLAEYNLFVDVGSDGEHRYELAGE